MILHPKKEDMVVAALTALAIAIHVVESSFPSIIPGIKPGLSNIITLICLFSFGFKTAAQVSLLRVFIASLLIGTFLSPTFILSLTGALSSLLAMGCLWFLFGRMIGPIGMAVGSSVAHILGQFYVAWFLYVPHPQLFKMLPVFIAISVILGLISGTITLLFLKSRPTFLIKTE
ncbi:MAG: Gx transporter family protein [Pseudomonadota bacterium]